VDPVYMFSLAAQHTRWASVRQAVVTGNVANANTSGYSALEVEPFAKVLADAAGMTTTHTHAGHVAVGGAQSGGEASRTWEITDTGAPVAIDKELMKADETNRAFALDTAIVGAFHRMLMMSVRSTL
jgi:flagellar basal-body rod protein FlgB